MNKIKKQLKKISKSLLVLIITFSQISFPLNVLAEQLDEGIETNNYKITINEIELTNDNFDIKDLSTKLIDIKQNYLGEDNYIFTPSKNMEIDFINRLYGDYKYNLSVSNEIEQLDTKNIIINNTGDNNQIININNIYYNNKTYFILGDTTKELTSLDIKNKFNNNLSLYNANIEILDQDNNLLEDNEVIEDNYKLKLKATYEDYEIINEIEDIYNLNIVEDINEDTIINNKDIQKVLLEEILKQENTEKKYNVIDATNVVLNDISEESVDNLITTFEYNNNIFLDEEIIVKYYIEGFENEVLKGIEGNINYDKNFLELTDIEINSIDGCINNNGHFVYLLNEHKEDGLLMTVKFKPLAVGIAEISIDNIVGATGAATKARLDTDSFEGEITILEYAKGGDIDEEEITTLEQLEEPKELLTVQENETKTSYIRPILLSGDNNIKKLIIKGHELNFNKDILEYELYVRNNIKSLEFDIELNDNNASYVIEGNENFQNGENNIKLIVTAENGNTKTYTIKVNKEAKNIIEEEVTNENNSSKVVIIILIILVIIGLIYVIFKDDEIDKK